MEFKGTKGQWNIDFNPLSSISPNGQYNVKAGEIGTPVCILPMPIGGKNPEEKIKANALLISKAPEMLEMLNEVLTSEYVTGRVLKEQVKKLIKEATELK